MKLENESQKHIPCLSSLLKKKIEKKISNEVGKWKSEKYSEVETELCYIWNWKTRNGVKDVLSAIYQQYVSCEDKAEVGYMNDVLRG